jgi:hypothetical protein
MRGWVRAIACIAYRQASGLIPSLLRPTVAYLNASTSVPRQASTNSWIAAVSRSAIDHSVGRRTHHCYLGKYKPSKIKALLCSKAMRRTFFRRSSASPSDASRTLLSTWSEPALLLCTIHTGHSRGAPRGAPPLKAMGNGSNPTWPLALLGCRRTAPAAALGAMGRRARHVARGGPQRMMTGRNAADRFSPRHASATR